MVQAENYKREYAFIFFVQRKRILLTTLLMTAIACGVSYLYPPVYSANGSFLVKSKKIQKDPEALERAEQRLQPVEEQDLFSEMEILTSEEVMKQAVDSLESAENAEELLAQLGEIPDERYLVLQKFFSAQVVPDSNVLDLKLLADSPIAAQTLLQAIMNQYIRYRDELYNPESLQVFFNQQLNRYRDDATQKEQEIRALISAGGVTQASTQIEHNIAIRKDFMNSITQLESEAVSQQLEVQHLEEWLASTDQVQFFSFIENKGIINLSAKFQDLYKQQQDILSRYLPDSEVAVLNQQQVLNAYNELRKEIRRYADDKKSQLKIIEGQIVVLAQAITDIEQENIDLRTNQIKLEQLEKDLSVIRNSYDIIFQRIQESMLGEDPQQNNLNSYISILTPAFADTDAVFPKPMVLIPLGIITGLILGLTLGFLYEFFDHTYKRPEEVEEKMKIPVVLSIREVNHGT
ncbi:MAG: GumC family protein [bacterium]